MKTTVFLAASAAALAMATPLDLEKRKIETEVVIEWKTVYVTEGTAPSVFAAVPHHDAPLPTTSTTSTTPTPAPETVAPVPDPTTVAPVPTTTVAPEPTIEPTPTEAAPALPAVDTPAPAAVDTPAAPVEAPPASTAQAQAPASQPTDYASTAVYHHNLHRMNYSAPALGWSDTYAGYAAQTAAKCVFAHDL
jgi:outer membrane biosynthesis protein TonB